MSEKIVFFNTGWMDFYKGLSDDTITGGGKHVESTGWGGEMFNFKAFANNLYGYVQPKIDKKYKNPSTIKLEKLGATQRDESLKGVTVVWTATHPNNGGTYIIGWYKNATVFRYEQEPPPNSRRRYKNISLGFFALTKARDGKLLPIDERVVQVQRQKKNWMGQSNVWYAENNPQFVNQVKDYINKGILPAKRKSGKSRQGSAKQLDPLKRIEVERKAVLFVSDYYEGLGYQVDSFEKDNLGWDLTATNNKNVLKLEVKGLSGSSVATELTPNEFKNLEADKNQYRVCVVTDVLTKPLLKIFAYSNENNEWTSEDGTILRFEKVISARIYAN